MHDMLDDLRVNREPTMVYDIRAKNPGASYGDNKLSHEDWPLVEAMIVVLQPARDGTRLLEGDQYDIVTTCSSLVVPTIYKIMYHADPSSLLRVPLSQPGRTMTHAQLPVKVQEARGECPADLQRRFRHDIDTCTKLLVLSSFGSIAPFLIQGLNH